MRRFTNGWSKYGGLEVSDARRLKALEDMQVRYVVVDRPKEEKEASARMACLPAWPIGWSCTIVRIASSPRFFVATDWRMFSSVTQGNRMPKISRSLKKQRRWLNAVTGSGCTRRPPTFRWNGVLLLTWLQLGCVKALNSRPRLADMRRKSFEQQPSFRPRAHKLRFIDRLEMPLQVGEGQPLVVDTAGPGAEDVVKEQWRDPASTI